jgi:hypothetical protein
MFEVERAYFGILNLIRSLGISCITKINTSLGIDAILIQLRRMGKIMDVAKERCKGDFRGKKGGKLFSPRGTKIVLRFKDKGAVARMSPVRKIPRRGAFKTLEEFKARWSLGVLQSAAEI